MWMRHYRVFHDVDVDVDVVFVVVDVVVVVDVTFVLVYSIVCDVVRLMLLAVLDHQ